MLKLTVELIVNHASSILSSGLLRKFCSLLEYSFANSRSVSPAIPTSKVAENEKIDSHMYERER